MSQTAVDYKTVALDPNFFNPYAGVGPPDCCYCAPTAVPVSLGTPQATTNVFNQPSASQQKATQQTMKTEQAGIQAQVDKFIQGTIPGLGGMAFMTKMEDAMRTLERGRIERHFRKEKWARGTAEMGAGPYNYNRNEDGGNVYVL